MASPIQEHMSIAFGPWDGAPAQEATSTGSVAIEFDRKLGPSVQLVVRGNSPEAEHIDELATDVWLMGAIQHRFRVLSVWQQWYPNGQDNVHMLAVGYKRLLKRRLVCDPAGLAFPPGTDLGEVVWGLWEHTQEQDGGDLGVTLGDDYLTGITGERTYKFGENLGQCAEEESEEGFLWDIDGSLEYSAVALNAIPFRPQPLELGVNVIEMQRASGSDYANVIYGDASENTVPVLEVDPDVAADPRGRWEMAVGWPTVELQATLDQRVKSALANSMMSASRWNLTIEPSRWMGDSFFMPGDHLVLVVPPTLAAPVGTPADRVAVQVESLMVQFDQDGSRSIRAVANERYDVALPS